MNINVELPDDTVVGFVNYVFGDGYGMSMGVIALSTEEIKNGKATYRTCKTVGESEAE